MDWGVWKGSRRVDVGTHARAVRAALDTVAEGSFMWSWANDAIEYVAKRGIEAVRQFGIENELGLLVEPCIPGGLPEAKECLAIAGRVLDAAGVWINNTDAGFILFTLHERVPD